eukprot:2033639-Rhodomonas_salina.3
MPPYARIAIRFLSTAHPIPTIVAPYAVSVPHIIFHATHRVYLGGRGLFVGRAGYLGGDFEVDSEGRGRVLVWPYTPSTLLVPRMA